MPTAADIRFWDRIAAKYAKSPISDEAAYHTKLAKTQSYMHKDMKVLELGCGTGSTAIVHAPHVAHLLATDFSGEMIGIARNKAERSGVTNLEFRKAAFEELANPADPLDMILGMSLLHLLNDPATAIARIGDWLKPGGLFVSSTACLSDDYKWFSYLGPVLRLSGLVPSVKMFTETELTDNLIAAGFDIEHRWKPSKRASVFIVARKRG